MVRAVALVVCCLVLSTGASGQTPPASGEALTVHPEAKAAIDRLKSPYCPGMMLAVCTSQGGALLRDSIQALAESGLPSDSIVERIVARYGEEWRAEPLRSGTGRWAWLLPPGMLVLGLGLVAGVLSRRRRRAPAPEVAVPVSSEDEARLREALKELEEEEEPVF